jgi:hypothetical protein
MGLGIDTQMSEQISQFPLGFWFRQLFYRAEWNRHPFTSVLKINVKASMPIVAFLNQTS